MLLLQCCLGWGKTRKILNPTFRVNPTYFSRVRFRVRVSKIPLKLLFFDQETFLIHQVKTVITRLPNGQQLNCIADNRPEKQTKKVPSSFKKLQKCLQNSPFSAQICKIENPNPDGFFARVSGSKNCLGFPGFRVSGNPAAPP